MKKILPAILLLALIAVGSWYALTRVSTSHWKTYTNTSYGYQVKYPANMTVSYIGENSTIPVEQSDDAIIGVLNGGPTEFQVTAYVLYSVQSGTSYNKQRSDLIALPLQKLAETVRQAQVNDKNPATPDKQTGQLKEITFAGQKGYSFTVTRTFNGLNGDYLLQPTNTTFDFIFIENKSGQKLMISYPLGDTVAEKIGNSFQLTASAK
ncbi:MAG: hypothetical protein ACHQU0_01945 [Candidatus Paceibacteria bacterium]